MLLKYMDFFLLPLIFSVSVQKWFHLLLVSPPWEICFHTQLPWPAGHITFDAMRFWYFGILWQQRYFCSSNNFKYSRHIISVDPWTLRRFYFGLLDRDCNCVVGFGFSHNHKMSRGQNGMEKILLTEKSHCKPSIWRCVHRYFLAYVLEKNIWSGETWRRALIKIKMFVMLSSSSRQEK